MPGGANTPPARATGRAFVWGHQAERRACQRFLAAAQAILPLRRLTIVGLATTGEIGQVLFAWRDHGRAGQAPNEGDAICLSLPGRQRILGGALLGGPATVTPGQRARLQNAAAQLARRLEATAFAAPRVSFSASGKRRPTRRRAQVALRPAPPRSIIKHDNDLAHALRTPLTAIRGFASVLLQPGITLSPDQQREFIQIIQKEAERLRQAVDMALEQARPRQKASRLAGVKQKYKR